MLYMINNNKRGHVSAARQLKQQHTASSNHGGKDGDGRKAGVGKSGGGRGDGGV